MTARSTAQPHTEMSGGGSEIRERLMRTARIEFPARTGPGSKMWRSWCDEITRPGKFLVGAILLAGMGTVTVQVPVYQVFCGLTTMLLVAMTGGFIFLPRIRVEGRFPDRTTAGESVTGSMRVSNKSALRPVLDLTIGFFNLPTGVQEISRRHVLKYIPRSGQATFNITLRPERRGLFGLPRLMAYTTFPFNFFRIGWPVRTMDALLVLPKFHPLQSVNIPPGQTYQPGGIAMTANLGASPEYVGNREYIPGEPVRRLDFRSWARLGKPVVREFQEEYYCRIALIQDTWVADDAADLLEASVSLSAAVGDALSAGEYLIDIFATGPELYVFRAGEHHSHLENILEILACVRACPTDPLGDLAPAIADELSNITTVICVLLRWDDNRRRLARAIQAAGCHVKLIVISSEAMSDSDFDLQVVSPFDIENGAVTHV